MKTSCIRLSKMMQHYNETRCLNQPEYLVKPYANCHNKLQEQQA